jgi:hypothetical protein
MAITRTQIAKQLLAQGGRIGLQGGGADMGQEKGPETGRAGRDDRQASENRVSAATNIGSMQKAFGPSIGPETKGQQENIDRIIAQRKRALEAISPSTKFSNKVIGGILGATTPFGVGRFLFNKAVDSTAMGYGKGKTSITTDDDTGDGEGENNFRETMIAQKFTPYQQDIVEDKVEELSPVALALQQRDLMGGPRAFAAGGGIMDLEQARQGYKLGKLVKKVTRGLKKIVKSDIGKAALIGGIGSYAMGYNPFAEGNFLRDKALPFIMDNKELALAAGLTAAPFLFQEDDEEEEKALRESGYGQGIDIQGIRSDPYNFLARPFRAEGGSMKEPVAKKTMPLLDMGGKEMDLRAEGGFVPIGRMEKADDVPARLSKNEFVFTAEAVRNAGEGDVDKGAEVMYNMMKNLESGGEVSEESQGLDGARKMFQTSQRLEEVL